MHEQWVRVEKRKYPRRSHAAWEALVLASDEHGLWLFAPAGERNDNSVSGVQLIPPGRWWVAWWWADPNGWWCAADVATPAMRDHDAWSYEDLEIDVWGDEAGFRGVVDEDEFEEARLAVPYPDEVSDTALSTRNEIASLMQNRSEPFGVAGWDMLRSALVEHEATD